MHFGQIGIGHYLLVDRGGTMVPGYQRHEFVGKPQGQAAFSQRSLTSLPFSQFKRNFSQCTLLLNTLVPVVGGARALAVNKHELLAQVPLLVHR